MEATINYAKDLVKNVEAMNEKKAFGFLNEEIEPYVKSLNKSIKAKTDEIDNMKEQIKELYSRVYQFNYTPAKVKTYAFYNGRDMTHYFSIPDGKEVEANSMDDNRNLVSLDYKRGEGIEVVAGYCFDLGAIVVDEYKYSVANDNKSCKFSVIGQYIQGVVENFRQENQNFAYRNKYYNKAPRDVNAGEFINGFYGLDKGFDINLRDLIEYYNKNKSTEIILKTAPKSILRRLLCESVGSPMPIYKIMNVDKDIYDDAVANGVEEDLYILKNRINDKDTYNKTQAEWLKMIKEFKKYQQDLRFYNIGINNRWSQEGNVLECLAYQYKGNIYLNRNYSFGKFANYVVNETINQGYSSIGEYVSSLIDYIRMCESNHTSANLYTSYLSITHNIATRNLSIHVTEDQEKQFQERYNEMPEFDKVKNYLFIKPEKAMSLVDEGNALNHCVASYIKRIIDGECLVYFMRKKKDESLITLEIEGGEIVQARGNSNRFPNEEEREAIKNWADKVKFVVNY